MLLLLEAPATVMLAVIIRSAKAVTLFAIGALPDTWVVRIALKVLERNAPRHTAWL
jgi:hypothetical protein